MTESRSTSIQYKIVRSRRATADIIIERDGGITVRAPKEIDDEEIAKIVGAKECWIHKNLAEWRDLNAARVMREFKNGEGFLYLGRAYRLLLVNGQKERLKLCDGRFALRRELAEKGDLDAAKAAFRDFYIEKGRERISARVAYYAPKAGMEIPPFDVRDLGIRWASRFPSGSLAFNWKCMMAPQKVIDYIVAHELCHRHRQDHDAAFWNEMDKILPDYSERKEWLRKNGAGLDL
jgi:predicted metal-dependent hydrolase